MKRKIMAFFTNIFLPLAVGLCVYLFFRKGTYINSIFGIEYDYKFNSIFGVFVKSWLCDILWAYALTHSLYFALHAFEHRVLISVVISICFATVCELLQLLPAVSGTFDILDIIFQIAAVLLATAVIRRREKIEKA